MGLGVSERSLTFEKHSWCPIALYVLRNNERMSNFLTPGVIINSIIVITQMLFKAILHASNSFTQTLKCSLLVIGNYLTKIMLYGSEYEKY